MHVNVRAGLMGERAFDSRSLMLLATHPLGCQVLKKLVWVSQPQAVLALLTTLSAQQYPVHQTLQGLGGAELHNSYGSFLEVVIHTMVCICITSW